MYCMYVVNCLEKMWDRLFSREKSFPTQSHDDLPTPRSLVMRFTLTMTLKYFFSILYCYIYMYRFNFISNSLVVLA